MAIGTTGGKVGLILGPIIAVFAMEKAVGLFPISEDTGPLYGLWGWLLFGAAVAIAAGLLVRWLWNRLLRVQTPGY